MTHYTFLVAYSKDKNISSSTGLLGVQAVDGLQLSKHRKLVRQKCPKKIAASGKRFQLLLPHPSCYKFYRCYRGQRVERTCPLGLLFNDQILRCDLQQKVDCSNRPLPKEIKLTVIDESSDASESFEVSTTLKDSKRNYADEGITNIGNATSLLIVNSALKIDLNKTQHDDYYYVHRSSVSSGADDFKAADSYVLNDISSEDNSSSDSEHNDHDDTDGDYRSSGDKHLNPDYRDLQKGFMPNGCPLDPTTHWRLPHRLNCSQYFECDFGRKVQKDCGEHLHYNYRLQVCDWPMDAKCQTIQSILLKYKNKMLERRRKLSEILMRP